MAKTDLIRVYTRKIIANRLPVWMAAMVCCMTACNSDNSIETNSRTPMVVSVQSDIPQLKSRTIIDGGTLPDASSIGVSLTASDGSDYDGVVYSNIQYTASGTDENQTWSCMSDVVPSLSTTTGKVWAYYPYNDTEDLDLTAIPVETESQTDYMYSETIDGLSMVSPTAKFSMKHALTNIRLQLVNGSYTGDASLKSIKITSPFFGTAAVWNTTTGTVSSVTGTGADLIPTLAGDETLSSEGLQLDIITIADESITSGTLSFVLEIGSNQYTANFTLTEAFLNGYTYQYTLNIHNTGLTINDATVVEWVEEEVVEV